MRLGQLSRKINVSSSQILNYLENELGVHVDASLNSKIDDHDAEKIVMHFSSKADEVREESAILTPNSEELIRDHEEVVVSSDEPEIDEIEIERSNEIISDEDRGLNEVEAQKEIETIKAKAERLEGLKVIGKIDLPPPPPPEMVEIDGVMYDKAELKKQRYEEKERKKAEAIRRREEKKKKDELRKLAEQDAHDEISKKAAIKANISFEEQRKKEEAALARKKRQEEKRRREKQRKHYEEKHLVVKEKTSVKKKAKKTAIQEEIKEEFSIEEPKSALGKFWKWLTSY